MSLALFLFVAAVVSRGAFSAAPASRRYRWLHRLGAILFFGGMLNFILYWHIAVAVGGDAIHGKVGDGHYYVASHGRFTEVSKRFFDYSYAHAVSIWITHPLGFLGGFLMYRAERLSKAISKPVLDEFEV